MSTIILVHGAMQTSATWDLVTPLLQRAGHRVYTPELTGMGPRGGPMTSGITLDTHIADLVRFFEVHDLHHVVLVGHSYAGMVITGVAARVASRIDHLVYIDAFVPEQGQAAMDFFPESVRRAFQELLAPDGFRIIGQDEVADMWHLEPDRARFARERLWDFSTHCFTQPLREDPSSIQIARSFLACVGPKNTAQEVFASFADRAKRESWRYHELSTGHECQIGMPEATAAIIAAACNIEPKSVRPMAIA